MPLLDDIGVITVDRLISEPKCAEGFLEIYETQSAGILNPKWRDLSKPQIVEEAVLRFQMVQTDLETSQSLGRFGQLQ